MSHSSASALGYSVKIGHIVERLSIEYISIKFKIYHYFNISPKTWKEREKESVTWLTSKETVFKEDSSSSSSSALSILS